MAVWAARPGRYRAATSVSSGATSLNPGGAAETSDDGPSPASPSRTCLLGSRRAEGRGAVAVTAGKAGATWRAVACLCSCDGADVAGVFGPRSLSPRQTPRVQGPTLRRSSCRPSAAVSVTGRPARLRAKGRSPRPTLTRVLTSPARASYPYAAFVTHGCTCARISGFTCSRGAGGGSTASPVASRPTACPASSCAGRATTTATPPALASPPRQTGARSATTAGRRFAVGAPAVLAACPPTRGTGLSTARGRRPTGRAARRAAPTAITTGAEA